MTTDGLRRDFLVIPQGSNWGRTWPILDGATGLALNLTGATARAQVRAFAGAADPVLYEFTIANGGIAIDAALGYITVQATPTISNAWTWTEGVFDIILTELSGTVTRISQGQIVVDKAVTR